MSLRSAAPRGPRHGTQEEQVFQGGEGFREPPGALPRGERMWGALRSEPMRVGRRSGGLQLNRRGQAGPREGEQGLPRGPGSGQGSDQEAQRRRGAAPGPQSSSLGCESRGDQRGKDGGPRPHRNPGRTLKPRPRPVSLQPLSEVPCRGWDSSGEPLTSGTGVPDGARSLELQMAVAVAVPLS